MAFVLNDHPQLFALVKMGLTGAGVLVLVVGSSTYAFTLMLGTFLAGLVLGSALFDLWFARQSAALAARPALAIALSLLLVLSVGILDYLTVARISVLYVMPVALATWTRGRCFRSSCRIRRRTASRQPRR